MYIEVFKLHKSGYLVSNLGRIKGKTVEFLKLTETPAGYQMVGAGLVHRVVYETFNGDISTDYEIHHKDNNKINNNIGNLQCVTKSQNQKYRYLDSDSNILILSFEFK